jgi:outer membrane protein assembly factor BamB
MIMKTAIRLTSLAAVVFLLGACETYNKIVGDPVDPPLKGERISILQLQRELVPNAELEGRPVILPEAWTNQMWPQAGGYPTHAMGHLALKPSGLEKAWSSSIGDGGGTRDPITAVPVVADNTVFTLDTVGEVTAFDLSTGKKKWEVSVTPKEEDGTGALGGGIAFDAGTLYVTAGFKNITALDAATGAQKWQAPIPAPGRAAPTVLDGQIYVTTIDNRLLVLSTADGKLLWNYAGVSETTNLLGSASAAADPTLIVLPLSTGDLLGLEPKTGKVLWQDSLAAVRRSGAMASIADIRALPVIDQGVVYAVSNSGRMVAIEGQTGQRIWQRELGSAETPWPAGDTIFVVTVEQMLAAIDRVTGGVRWTTAMPRGKKSAVWAGPALAGGRLVLVSSDGQMAEVDPQNGKIITTQDIADKTLLPPVIAGSTLLILGANGDLTAYR